MRYGSRALAVPLVLGSLALAVAASGCRPAPPGGAGHSYRPEDDPLVNPLQLFEPYPAERPEVVAEDEVLVRHLEGNPGTLNPIFHSSTYEGYVQSLLYESLFRFDAGLRWEVNPNLVESFQESADHLLYRVRLKEGLKWHDGHPLTARDVRFTWQVLTDPRVPATAAGSGKDQLADVRVVDDRTLEFVHKEALATNRWNAYLIPIPEHLYGHPVEREKDPSLRQSDYYNRLNRQAVVGNGPYRLLEWVPDDRIVLERWEGYPGPKPHFQRVVFLIQKQHETALLLFRKGALDEVRLQAPDFAAQTNDPEFRKVGVKVYGPAWRYYYIAWNLDGSNPFFGDVRVRRAMAHALDIPKVIRDLCYGLVKPCHGIFHPDSWMYNPEIELFEYDLDAAAHLLDEAGWTASEEDGWRYKRVSGQPVKLEFTLTIPQGAVVSPKVAAIFQGDLKRLGVSMLTRTVEWATFQEMSSKGDFQAMIAGWGTGTDPDLERNIFHSSAHRRGRNYGGYSNPRVDELFDEARREFDQARRAQLYGEIQKLIYQDQPYLFIYSDATFWALHKRLRGVRFSSARGVFNFYPAQLAWWVPRDETLRNQ